MRIFIAALLIISANYKQPKCPSTEEWMNKHSAHIQWEKILLSNKKEESTERCNSVTASQMHSLGERSQSQRLCTVWIYLYDIRRNCKDGKQTVVSGAGSSGGHLGRSTKGHWGELWWVMGLFCTLILVVVTHTCTHLSKAAELHSKDVPFYCMYYNYRHRVGTWALQSVSLGWEVLVEVWRTRLTFLSSILLSHQWSA